MSEFSLLLEKLVNDQPVRHGDIECLHSPELDALDDELLNEFFAAFRELARSKNRPISEKMLSIFTEKQTWRTLAQEHGAPREAAKTVMNAVRSGSPIPRTVRAAFGLVSDTHIEVLRARILDGSLTLTDLVQCHDNGAELTKRLGAPMQTVPLVFETESDVRAGRRPLMPPSYLDIGLPIETHGVTFTLMVSSPAELWRASTFTEKEPDTLEWLRSTLRDDDVLWDAGANVGMYTLFALACNPTARVVAFEPDSINFYRLNKNLLANKFSDRAWPYSVALSDAPTYSAFHSAMFMAGTADHFLEPEHGALRGEIPSVHRCGAVVTTLDAFLASDELPRPTHLKIDVDGPELKVVQGASKVASCPSLREILIECFDDEVPEIERILAPNGFRLVSKTDWYLLPTERGQLGNKIFSRVRSA